MILIYSDRYSSRLRYSLDLVIRTMMGLSYELTHDLEGFRNASGPRLAYASDPSGFDGCITIRAVNLLSKKGCKTRTSLLASTKT